MFKFFKSRSPLAKPCSNCGAPSRFGYSEHAESALHEIDPLCLDCLKPRVSADYSQFLHGAVVIQPLAAPPVYVFLPLDMWQAGNTGLCEDVERLLGSMDEACRECKAPAQYAWIESQGLTPETFASVLDQGFSTTLLPRNPPPVSVCADCCVTRIISTLGASDLSNLEVCGPRGAAQGFVLPMAY